MGEVREPIKKNSIAKKNKIIADGFELICNKGYHNVSCVDIAKYCCVSTGIIYQYFKDKRNIFIEGVKLYSDKIMFPLLKIENKKHPRRTVVVCRGLCFLFFLLILAENKPKNIPKEIQ